MGRRIYDENGEFVWKYVFGRQSTEMSRYTQQYHIGRYIEESRDNSEDGHTKGDEEYYEWTDYMWQIDDTDLPKLKKLYKELCNGYTEKELQAIGMKGIKDFVKKQSKDWQKHYAADLKWVLKAKSSDDFQYYGSGGQGYNFEIYDIYAKAIESKIKCSCDFLEMTKAFIKHIQKYKSKCFWDEY